MAKESTSNKQFNPNNLYAYYNLVPPPKEWVHECVTNKTLI